jgi:hypothetical protein
MNRQFPGRDFHPLVICAFVAHQYDELNYRWSRERDKFEAQGDGGMVRQVAIVGIATVL